MVVPQANYRDLSPRPLPNRSSSSFVSPFVVFLAQMWHVWSLDTFAVASKASQRRPTGQIGGPNSLQRAMLTMTRAVVIEIAKVQDRSTFGLEPQHSDVTKRMASSTRMHVSA